MIEVTQQSVLEPLGDIVSHYRIELLAAFFIAVISLTFGAVRAGFLRLANRLLPVLRVDGKWHTQIERNGTTESHEHVEMRQLGSRVWGLATHVKGGDSYRLRGDVHGDKVSMTYRQASPHGNDVGAILLKIATDGRVMDGFEIGCDLPTGAVSSRRYVWTRRP